MLRLLLALCSNWLSLWVMRWLFLFFILGKVIALVFVVAPRQAAIRCLVAASALMPMAQMKPSSSRPTAVMIFFWSLPAANSLI